MLFRAHDDKGGSPVVQTGSVASRDRAALFKGRTQFGQDFRRGSFTREFIRIKYGFALFGFDGNRNDFVLESTALDGRNGSLLGTGRNFVLVFTGYAEFFSDVFGSDAHVIVIERIPQTILDHDIDEFAVAHTQTPTSFAAGNKRSVGHAFHTAGNDDVVIASQDGLSSQFHTFQAGTADFIDSKSRNFNRQASFDGCLTSRVLAQSSLEDVTKNDFVNFFTRDISSFQGFLDDNCTEFRGRQGKQAATKFADSRSYSTCNYNFAHN